MARNLRIAAGVASVFVCTGCSGRVEHSPVVADQQLDSGPDAPPLVEDAQTADSPDDEPEDDSAGESGTSEAAACHGIFCDGACVEPLFDHEHCGRCDNHCSHLESCEEGLCAPRMIMLPSGFGIYASEVTRAEYEAWLKTEPSTFQQGDLCDWNDSFEPHADCLTKFADKLCASDCSQHPQVCVDWCDAKAFCEARGHRLCSRIGGGVLPYEFAGQADISQWANACSSGGVFDFVYGPEFKEGACNTFVDDIPKTVPVGSYPGCQSAVPGYEGVFDLLGNVGEWSQASLFDPADCAAAAPPIFSTHDPPPPRSVRRHRESGL